MSPGFPMLPGFLWPGLIYDFLAHHGEPADPTLLVWIKHRLDQLLDLGPWTVVLLLGLVLVVIPVGLMVLYWTQRDRIPPPPPVLDEPSGDSTS